MPKATCSEELCPELVHARGLCKRHYSYRQKGLHLPAICQTSGCPNERPRVNGRRYCDECRDRLRRDGDARRKRDGRVNGRQAEYERRSHLKRFGLTPADVDACPACEACGSTEVPQRWGTWYGDHDHSCCKRGCRKCFRGLVCTDCNLRRITALENEADEVLRSLAQFEAHSPLARVAQFLLKHRQLRLV